jgi:phosphoglucomutase
MTPPDDAKAIRFGTSGWRAVLAEEFTFGNARRVIAAIARVLAADGRAGVLVLVGYDTRFLADRFAAEAAAIFVRHGFPAQVSVRPVPTPVLAFEIRRIGAVGGVNFTASHNPPQYLGIKFSTSDGAPALPEVTRRIEAEIASDSVQDEPAPASDRIERFDPVAGYLDDLARKVDSSAVSRGSPHFSLDLRFGTAAGFLDAFIEQTGAALSRLHAKADPLFGGESRSAASPRWLAVEIRSHRCAWASRATATRTASASATRRAPTCSPTRSSRSAPRPAGPQGRRGGVPGAWPRHTLDAVAKKFGVPLYETPVGSSTSARSCWRARSASAGRRARA